MEHEKWAKRRTAMNEWPIAGRGANWKRGNLAEGCRLWHTEQAV